MQVSNPGPGGGTGKAGQHTKEPETAQAIPIYIATVGPHKSCGSWENLTSLSAMLAGNVTAEQNFTSLCEEAFAILDASAPLEKGCAA